MHAAADDFKVRLRVGEDTIAPTTPTALTAIPVAETQIDLSWGASTDDFLLGGYQVFRDSVHIATTTLTTYSDSGLTSSTTYSYFVRAFDDSFNYSSSSNAVSTTTLSPAPTSTPPTPPVDDDTGGSSKDITLLSFDLTPSLHSVSLTWKTSRYAQYELRWGRTSSYESGFVSNGLFKKEHSTVIAELESGTTYEYELIGYDRDGDRTVLKKGQFKTLDAPDALAPTNVSNLKAEVNKNTVQLSWDNPQEEDFSHVRVVRSHLFYPVDPYDGFVAYQGSGISFSDINALSAQDIQYYTVFSYDQNGNVSSGAIVSAQIPDLQGGTAEPEPTQSDAPPIQLGFSDIEFLQEGERINSGDVDTELPLQIRIAYEKLPEHLKTITISLAHPENKESVFSFLLKINRNKMHYEASIAPLRTAGVYPVEVAIFDYQTKVLHTIEGSITVKVKKSPVLGVLSVEKSDLTTAVYVSWLLLLLALLYILHRIFGGVTIEHKTYEAFGKTRFVASIAILTLFGGACAYILISIARYGAMEIEGDSVSASVLAPSAASGNLQFAFGILTLLIFFAVIASIYYFKKK